MTQEQIKRAANSYIDDFLYNHIDYTVIHDNYETGKNNAICEFGPDIFKAGAQWRINSVWHDAQEEPCNGKILIVETKNYGIFIAGPNIDTKDYECLKKEFDINRWAYIEDLLPR